MWRAFWDATFCARVAARAGALRRGARQPGARRAARRRRLVRAAAVHRFSPRGAARASSTGTRCSPASSRSLALAHHGALFLAWKTDGPVRERSRAAAAAALSRGRSCSGSPRRAATAAVAPGCFAALRRAAARVALRRALFVAGLATSFVARRARPRLAAFLGSCAFLLGLLAATAASVFPAMIRSSDDRRARSPPSTRRRAASRCAPAWLGGRSASCSRSATSSCSSACTAARPGPRTATATEPGEGRDGLGYGRSHDGRAERPRTAD